MSDHRLTLMVVHAHPDDEAISTGGVLLRYAEEGIHTVLVTCTRGEEGEIVRPELDTPENKLRLAEIRAVELEEANKLLNVGSFHQLGYRDSGMAGTPANEHPECFHQADLHEATGRLVALVRQHRPHVMISYNADGSYGHPDHIAAHKITKAAFAAAGDSNQYPEAGPAWEPKKLYYTAMRRGVMLKAWEIMRERGMKTPLDDPNFDLSRYTSQPAPPAPNSTISIGNYIEQKLAALLCHRTQISDTWGFLVFPQDLRAELLAHEEFVLGESRVALRSDEVETDLFAGLR